MAWIQSLAQELHMLRAQLKKKTNKQMMIGRIILVGKSVCYLSIHPYTQPFLFGWLVLFLMAIPAAYGSYQTRG